MRELTCTTLTLAVVVRGGPVRAAQHGGGSAEVTADGPAADAELLGEGSFAFAGGAFPQRARLLVAERRLAASAIIRR